MNCAKYYEKKEHTNSEKLFNLYLQRMPEYFACTPLHWHTEFEINYILEGCADFMIGDVKFTSEKGDIIVATPNVLHSVYPHERQKQVYVTFLFSPEMLGMSIGDRLSANFILPIVSGELSVNPRITKEHFYYSKLILAMDNIISAAEGNTTYLDLLIKSELMRFFWLLNEAGDITKKTFKASINDEIIYPAIEYINAHFSEDISIQVLAKEVNFSESYFIRMFHKKTGVSAIEYLNQIRIKAVCEQLKLTETAISEIAFNCGFRNLSNFNRVFKRIVGTTPKAFRDKEN